MIRFIHSPSVGMFRLFWIKSNINVQTQIWGRGSDTDEKNFNSDPFCNQKTVFYTFYRSGKWFWRFWAIWYYSYVQNLIDMTGHSESILEITKARRDTCETALDSWKQILFDDQVFYPPFFSHEYFLKFWKIQTFWSCGKKGRKLLRR